MKTSHRFFSNWAASLTIWILAPYVLSSSAGEYRGADAVLKSVLRTNRTAAEIKLSPAAQLRADLNSFQEKAGGLNPSECATQWLSLFDQFIAVANDRQSTYASDYRQTRLQAEDLINALPPSAAWPDLAKQIEARPAGEGTQLLHQIGLQLLAHTLTGNVSARRNDVTVLEKWAAQAKPTQVYSLNSIFEQLNRSLVDTLESPDAALHSLERTLAAQQTENGYASNLRVPDLVSLVGRDKAEAFIRKALVQSKEDISFEESTETEKLARKLALELVHQLKKPHWELVNTLDAVELYEALDKQFPPSKSPEPQINGDIPSISYTPDRIDYERKSARAYYFLGLIAQGRITNAIAAAKQFERDGESDIACGAITQMERAGYTHQLDNFLHDQLQLNPELPLWDEYIQVSAHAGHTENMVNLVKSSLSRENLSKGQRTRLRQTFCKALLANDDLDAGVTELRELIKATAQQSNSRRSYMWETPASLGLKLAKIGKLSNRPEWMEEGITIATNSVLDSEKPSTMSWSDSTPIQLAEFLAQIGRGPEAEDMLAFSLARATRGAERTARFGSRGPAPGLLAALVRLYHNAGRHEDVLKLFNDAPFWGAKDIAQLENHLTGYDELNYSVYSGKHVSTPLAYYAAAALAKTGHPAEARKILDQLLSRSSGCDRLYELLLELDNEHAAGILDGIFAKDPFEERPLIWKAHWLRVHQRLSEAEETVRKAIAIDPTDGEEGAGDRLRAYAELAKIRDARGDKKEATMLKGAVEAVRQSELADQFHEVDMLKRAIDLYSDALNKFADAYCIHARLAVQLSDLGKYDEAAEHYRRAYELMPDSFGRVESHCFGCERAFDGERAQGIAERVFTQLAQKNPTKPQIHYLLGYLRQEQSRYTEAMDSYRTAVKLDPDYLNAWVKMESISEHLYIPSAERDSITFNILRLDPLQHRLTPGFQRVSDLATLWNQVAAISKSRSAIPQNLYPLAASKAEPVRNSFEGRVFSESDSEPYSRVNDLVPGKAIGENGFIAAALQLFAMEIGDE